MRHVRIEHDGQVGRRHAGRRTRSAPARSRSPSPTVERWLSPVTPSKIIATHLTYRSRAEEYKMARLPADAVVLHEAAVVAVGASRSR